MGPELVSRLSASPLTATGFLVDGEPRRDPPNTPGLPVISKLTAGPAYPVTAPLYGQLKVRDDRATAPRLQFHPRISDGKVRYA